MSYAQLIQFKRLEERALVFLSGKQLMFSVFFGLLGLMASDWLKLTGWPKWLAAGLLGLAGVIAGSRFRGLYGYQYVQVLGRSFLRSRQARPAELYDRPVEAGVSYVLGAPDGGALVLRQAPETTRRQTGGQAARYRLEPVDLAQYPPQAIGPLMQRWTAFWAGVRPPVRLISHSRPFQAGHVVEETRAEGLRARQRWRAEGLAAYSRFMERLTRQSAMYRVDHELLVWARSETEAQATVSSLTGWLGVSARPVRELTPLLVGDYIINWDHLQPVDPRHPYLVLMVSHEFSGEWSWADPLVTLLRQPFPVSIAVDVERSLPSNEALRELVKYENVLLDVLSNNRGGRDPKAEAALQDVQLAMAKANAGLSLHFATVVVAVEGLTLEEVRRHAEAVRSLCAARLALVVLPGGQGELVKFFTDTPRKRAIELPELSHNVTSDGMAALSGPLGFRRRSVTDGIFWGIGSSGGQDTYPIWWEGFGSPGKPAAYHGLFLGMSGYGKTVSLQALLYREALRGTQVVLMEPQGHSRRLAELVGREGATYNPLSMRTMQINPLDPISDNLNEQKEYVKNLVRLMLRQLDPDRRLSTQEVGLLDAALGAVYDGLDDPLHTPAIYVPRLEQLCFYLRQVGADGLAADLELNFVQGSMGTIYNQATNIDTAMEADVVCYDFKDIPTESRTLIYTLVLGRIQRTIRATGRVRRRVVAVDEFGWMAQEPMLAETMAMWIKTFRTFGCGVWLAEQDLIRLTGGAASGDLSGHSIIGNSTFQLFFHHESAAADLVAQTFPNVGPYRSQLESFPRPQETGLAEAVLRIPDGAYHVYMLLAEAEQRTLIGS